MMLHIRALAASFLTISTPAFASPPEQLYGLGPTAGQWALEYNGQAAVSSEAERPHSLELWRGVSDRVAIGVEIESEVANGGFRVEEFSVQGLFALTPRDAEVVAAVLLQAGVSTEGNIPQLEGRLIASHESERWDALANLIVRRQTGDEVEAELAYAVVLHRRVAPGVGLGLEASGSVARLSGFADDYSRRHYIGPSLAIEVEPIEGRELELGIKLLRRIVGEEAAATTIRFTAGLEF